MALRPPVLVVSIDGLAPRHITQATMPTLTSLAGEGASTFRARTVSPPWTLPVHTTMLRGVLPEAHGVLDNTPVAPAGDTESFLRRARQGGLSTAAFLNWHPLDRVLEPDAVEQRFVIDGGYGPDDDRRAVDAAISTIADHSHDLVFVYLSQPDVDGHRFGWDSAEYLVAAGRSDDQLARLLDAVGSRAPVLVTTDHGGIGRNHGDEVVEVMETFVVVRAPGRVRAATTWPTASVLQIAPTVADLVGVEPDPGWTGTSLLGAERALVDVVFDLLASMAAESYGERVTMLDHSLQSAAAARAAGEGTQMVLACLLHDIGHVLGEAGDWGLPGHAAVAARALQPHLSPAIVEPIRLHVDAKRYRVAVDPASHEHLSLASQMSLIEQGGPLSAAEAEAFARLPFSDEALRLRAHDDDGKVEGLEIPSLESFRPLLEDALTRPAAVDPSWARDACRCEECRDPSSDQHLVEAPDLEGWTVVREETTPDGDEVLLHHRTGERHLAVIPGETAEVWRTEPWPPACAVDPRSASEPLGPDLTGFCRRLARHGLALLHDCGTAEGTVTEVGAAIGFVRETNYGRLFDVRAEPDPENLAFSPAGLSVHTDNPYREPCPSVQLLHCLRAAPEGGASRFVDGFAAAGRLREEDPDSFELLTTIDVTFRFHGDGVDLRAARPLIELDRSRELRAVSVNNRSMEAPRLPTATAARFYAAYRRFVEVLARPDHAVEITLRPGELVAFDNRRVLHGRRAFLSTAPRHLQGCYVDMDAIRSLATVTMR